MPRSKCPTKWKKVYPGPAEAKADAARLRTMPGGRRQGAYQCPEGHWHVGSASVKNHAANLRRKGKRGR